MKEIVYKYALKNAFDFKTTNLNPNVILGFVLKENPDLRSKVPQLRSEIEKAALEISKLKLEEIEKKLKQLAPQLTKAEKVEVQEGPLKPLEGAKKGHFVVRIAPSPSGLLHIGHTYGTSLNYEYAKMYEGKLLLRIEDTNPENIYTPAYELIPDDANWLTNNGISQVIVQSSRLGIYYDYAEKLVQLGKAYVCTCPEDDWREMKKKAQECICRKLSVKENALRYAKMFNEYAEGEAVLRLKTDMQDKNPAMRDFPIMRIVEHVHPKTGKAQRVWPLMVFSVAVDDHDLGVTHVLNGKEHADNATKEKIIMEDLGWEPPFYRHWGRINFEDFAISKSKTKIAIEEGQFSGWDDIRLPFLRALRRRGYQSQAFRRFALEIGLSLNDKTVSVEEFWKNVNAFNKEIVDPQANRYFFVDNPLKITIKGAPEKKVQLDLHPSFPQRGKRILHTEKEFYLAKSDFIRLGEGYVHRLMDCCNFELRGEEFHYVSENYEDYKNAQNRGQIIHWLPVSKNNLKVEVLSEKGVIISGLGEENMKNLKERETVQLERRYFATLDKIEKNKLIFWYLHK